MKYQYPKTVGLAAIALASITLPRNSDAAAFAAAVIDYQPGAGATLTTPSAALGEPEPIVGAGSGFDGILSPFNPHYEGSQLAQIGEGGSITLQLSNFAVTSAGSPEIGVFTNFGLGDSDYPNGQAGADLDAQFATFGRDSARVEVSDDGISWFDLGDIDFDQPSTYYTDAPTPFEADGSGLSAADFALPHGNQLADYAGLDWTGVKAALGGSAGGEWLDISGTGLGQVGWIRFSLADDGLVDTELSFELDAVSIAGASLGAAIPIPEPSAAALLLLGLAATLRRRR